MDIEIAKLVGINYDQDSGDLYLRMKVIDPVWRAKILNSWQELDVKLIIEDKRE